MVESKSVFWQALILTIIIFGTGLMFGYYIESSRVNNIELNLLNSETTLLDAQMRTNIVGESNVNCAVASANTFAFADKVYDEAKQLEGYDASSKFSKSTLLVLHKRYDLLRMILWDESKKLKSKCAGLHTIVYFFDYSSEDVALNGKQDFFSEMLLDIKYRNPDKIILIPIASNLDLVSVQAAMDRYGVSERPSVLIDEKKVVSDVTTLDKMEELIFKK